MAFAEGVQLAKAILRQLACDSRGAGRWVLDGTRLGLQFLHRLAYVISCLSLRERDESWGQQRECWPSFVPTQCSSDLHLAPGSRILYNRIKGTLKAL